MIRYSIITQNDVDMPLFDTILAFCNKLNLSFVVVLDIDINAVARKCQIHFL